MKTIKKLEAQTKDVKKKIKTVQDAIPISKVYDGGIFELFKNREGTRFSKTYKFTDINYITASEEDKRGMFKAYSEILNALDSEAENKMSIVHRRINKSEFEADMLMQMRADPLNHFRTEYNNLVLSKVEETENIMRELYLTVTVTKKNTEEARHYFSRVGGDLLVRLSKMGSRASDVSTEERLRLLHDFYRTGEEENFRCDIKDMMRKGHSFKDSIAPDSFEFKDDYFTVGDRFGRVITLKSYASYISDNFMSKITNLANNMILSIDMVAIPTDEAVKEVQKRVMSVESNITQWQQKQNKNNNFSAVVPFQMEQQREEMRDFFQSVTAEDERMFIAVVTLVHTAENLQELNLDTERIFAAARQGGCDFGKLRFQQREGLNTALPIGAYEVAQNRTLTTASLAILSPYHVQEIFEKRGTYFGINQVSRNLIMIDKEKLMNPNCFILGVPGSGKSFNVKANIAYVALNTNDDIVICDPENEYGAMITEFGGEVIKIAAGSNDHINAMDMAEGYGDGQDSVREKAQFILSLFEQLDPGGINAIDQSIIDRATRAVYDVYSITGVMPTLKDLYDELLKNTENQKMGGDKARDLALKLEVYTQGSLDVFAFPTNVDTNNRLLVYDIFALGEQLKPMGALVITDAIMNRVTRNWAEGKRTHVYIDEFHVLFATEHSAVFFNNAWRRFRKRNAFPTAITQNVEYLLDSTLAATMLSNSELIVMLNQASGDRDKLAHLLDISDEQMGFISGAEPGSGLIKYGNSLVPFSSTFPNNTELYKLMTTKPTEEDSSWTTRSTVMGSEAASE